MTAFLDDDHRHFCTHSVSPVFNDDVTLEVEGLWFSTFDQPEAVFRIDYGIDGVSKSEIRRRLKQVLVERRPVELPARATYRLR
jgi:hypothetical protein